MVVEKIVGAIVSGIRATVSVIAAIDFEEVGGAFIAGLATSPHVNVLFPVIVSMYFENSESLLFLTEWLLRAIPFVLLFVLFVWVIDSALFK